MDTLLQAAKSRQQVCPVPGKMKLQMELLGQQTHTRGWEGKDNNKRTTSDGWCQHRVLLLPPHGRVFFAPCPRPGRIAAHEPVTTDDIFWPPHFIPTLRHGQH